MATKNWTEVVAAAGAMIPEGCKIIEWAGLGSADDGLPYYAPNYPDKTVQVSGTPGAGGAGTIEGGIWMPGETALYGQLVDQSDNTLAFVATDITNNRIETISQNAAVIRPRMTAGDGSTSVKVRLLISTVARR